MQMRMRPDLRAQFDVHANPLARMELQFLHYFLLDKMQEPRPRMLPRAAWLLIITYILTNEFGMSALLWVTIAAILAAIWVPFLKGTEKCQRQTPSRFSEPLRVALAELVTNVGFMVAAKIVAGHKPHDVMLELQAQCAEFETFKSPPLDWTTDQPRSFTLDA